MPRSLVAAAAGGVLAALLFLALLIGSRGGLILAFLTQLPLFAVGLWLGVMGAAIAAVTATGIMAVAGSLTSGLMYGLVMALPVVILTRQALLSRPIATGGVEWYPPGRLAMVLYGIAAFGIVVAILVLAMQPGGAQEALEAFLRLAFQQLVVDAGGNAQPADVEAIAAAVAPIYLAMTAIAWQMMVVANGILAQGLVGGFRVGMRPSPGMASLALPRPLLVAAGVCALAAFLPGDIGLAGLNLLLAMAVPFFLAGLAVLHAWANTLGARLPVLAASYAAIVLFGFPVLVIVGVGIIEQWAGLRRRFAASRQGDE